MDPVMTLFQFEETGDTFNDATFVSRRSKTNYYQFI